ncbi:hypothetical protein CEN45_01930 [Fischerella thermalis CCMEE 5198]|uniref:baeRF7 domain-containing protein n=1 Tax=Fischerella thermalis TaxID=372787 RepID=UPI000C801965|nr:hypothetical protein [Fischerella thermalis]PMB03078.1 hypothetical protein CI594_06485 [Fischerella thermalis CCMEE 5196]PMB27195.1 hypothetical protein CEN45_01930 [Fischerella thermalis CCMEE 5198]
MQPLSIDEIKTLVENTQSPCVSLYMPTQKAGPETRQNPIRFKNLIREAEERLTEMGMDDAKAVEFLQPAKELDKNEFWQHQDVGLAIFISPSVFRYYQLPMDFQELVVVSNQFHLKPLLHLVNNDGRFFVLALSQDNVRFFEGTHYNIQEVEVENMPKSLDEALLYDETAKEGQRRIGTSRGGTANPFSQPGEFHGQGSPDRDEHQKDILQFFHIIDDALHEKLRDEKAPLLLAGVEYLFAIYREANSYKNLLEEGIHANVDIIKPGELHEQAWQIVEPIYTQSYEAIMELYQQIAGEGTGRASSDLKEIIPAAYYQRVDYLLVPVDHQVWGSFDSETMAVDLHSEPQPDDQDMLDFAAIHTLLNGGAVYTVDAGELPDGVPAAAIFRY